MLKSLLGWFRFISLIEGLSWLVLLLIAMPLKHLAGIPGPVKVVGMAHGVLFIAYLLLWNVTALQENWAWRRRVEFFVAAIIPGGALWVERVLRREQEASRVAAAVEA